MLLAVDIGNTNIKFGLFEGGHLVDRSSIPARPAPTENEIRSELPKYEIDRAIVCSVVPDLNRPIAAALGVPTIFVANDCDLGVKILYKPLSDLGTDRLVNAFAAAEKYGVPFVVCSFGTATTFDVVDRDRTLLGGAISPGMRTMAEALHISTAKLPEVEIKKPQRAIGGDTRTAIVSGIFYGHVAMVEGMIMRLKLEAGDDPRVIATGGFASMIAENISAIDIVDEQLLLDGLRLIDERHHPA